LTRPTQIQRHKLDGVFVGIGNKNQAAFHLNGLTRTWLC
jgi:hypothetical protein